MLKMSEVKRYAKRIDEYLKPNLFRVCAPPCGVLRHPFVDPSAQYAGTLWDWDSYWAIRAMISGVERYKKDADFDYESAKEKIILHAKGTVLNFFENQEPDGFIPMMIASSGPFHNYYRDAHRAGEKHNMHKPFLLQNILQISRFAGDFSWVDVEAAVKYMRYYETAQFNEKAGLFYWVNDVMIGIDNNPTVFFRKKESSADIYLNAFLALEYDALVTILTACGDSRVAEFKERATKFKETLNRVCYDEKDQIYYSQDLSFDYTPFYANGFLLHENMQPHWHAMPIKVRFWGCFIPLYAKIADENRARAIEKRHLQDPAVMAKYGVRTVASDEPFYNLEKTSNPSNWLGAIWGVSNFVVYQGLKNYNLKTAKVLAEKTIRLFEENLEKSGDMYESYLPDTGEPCLYPGFTNWNVLVLEMLKEFGA